MKTKKPSTKETNEENEFPGYPRYPASEDIYSKFKEEQDIDPEDILRNKDSIENLTIGPDGEFIDDLTGETLDVPGAELDDEREAIGMEDEENNYYSIGGDNHNDLEEEKGD